MTKKCDAKLFSLDDAIAHAEEVASKSDTPCARQHQQLAGWLSELRELRVGNAAAMREALEAARSALERMINMGTDDLKAYNKVCAALAAPPRNCDVGNPAEQAKRMDDYCASYDECIGVGWRCANCPLCSIDRCELAWAQMPCQAST